MYIVVLHVCLYEGVGSPGTGAIVNCQVGTGNKALALWKSSQGFEPPEPLFWPLQCNLFNTREKVKDHPESLIKCGNLLSASWEPLLDL